MTRALSAVALAALLVGCTAEEPGEPAPVAEVDVTAVDTVLEPCPDQPDTPASGAETLPPLAFDCVGGGRLDLSRAPGAPTVLNLWGSWCGPCRDELPLLQDFVDVAGDRVRLIGVISRDGVAQADSFATDAEVSFPGAFDAEGRLMAELGINALPYTFFLDADGALVHTESGPVTSVDELTALVAEHLGVRL